MWLNYGRITVRLVVPALLGISFGIAAGDSQAYAERLKNGVRVGDRSAMTIVRIPRAGERRLVRRPAPTRASAPHPETQSWFWETMSADRRAASPERWHAALAALRARRAEGTELYGAKRLRDIAEAYGTHIAAAARKHRVSEIMLTAVIVVESAGQTRAVSPKGARGLMQLIPATARRFGVADTFDPAQNILGGAAYLDWLLRSFGEDPILALAGYNAGEGAIESSNGVPPYAETRDYVVKVFDALTAAEALCPVPADSPRRGCGWPSSPRT